MQPRTLAALAVAAGLTLGTGVLAIGATLMPSGASPRPYTPVAADVASDPGTTIVTDVQTVYDDPPAAAPSARDAAPVSEANTSPEPHTSTTPPSAAPVVTAAPAPRSDESQESSDDEHEFDDVHETGSSSSGGSVDD